MDAASHLTGCEQARDDLAVLVQHLGVGVDLQTAHGVVDAGSDLDGIVGSGVQGVGEAGAAKVGVVLCLNIAVPVVHGLSESSLIDAHGLAQLLVGSTGDGVALLDVALNDAGVVDHRLIDDQPTVAAGLSDLSSRDDVAGADLVDEALAFGVDEDRAVAAQTLGDEGSGVGIQGQGIEMAEAIGAATVDMDQIQIHPTVEANTAALITEGLRGDGAVLINAEGKRFIDEVGTRDVVSAAEIAQTGSYSWLVVDQAMVDASSVIQGYIKKGYTVTGQTYEELAKAMGVDEAAFAETMKTWNGYVAAKNDPDFGRTSFAKALDTAPYYAVKVTAGVHHTMGGLKINTNTEVLKADGSVIPGLFAAGEVTGGVHGANRLGGNAVADFTVFGRIAGAAASKYAA